MLFVPSQKAKSLGVILFHDQWRPRLLQLPDLPSSADKAADPIPCAPDPNYGYQCNDQLQP